MRRIREVLRLRDEFGASVRRIAAACRMPRTTVRDYLRRLESAELRFGDVREWSDAELERRLFPPPAMPSRPLPDWSAVERELGRRGVTLQLLWQEYLAWIMHVRSFCATGTLCYQGVSHQVKGPIGTLLIRVY